MAVAIQRRRDTAARQKEIVAAAKKILVSSGSEHLTVGRIAKEVGFSEGAIYRHFRSKKDILSLLVDDIEEVLMADLRTDFGAGTDPLLTLEKIIVSHISAIEKRKGTSFQIIAEIVSLGDKTLNKKTYALINRYVACLTDVFSEGVQAGSIKSDIDLDALGMLFFCMTEGLVNTWTLSNYSIKLKDEQLAFWDILRRAIVTEHGATVR